MADLFGETKYSISFFQNGQKINLNDRVGDIGIGYYPGSTGQVSNIICLKGAIDAPKIFNRFKHVDAPER